MPASDRETIRIGRKMRVGRDVLECIYENKGKFHGRRYLLLIAEVCGTSPETVSQALLFLGRHPEAVKKKQR